MSITTVLLVEDEPMLRALTVRGLRRIGYSVSEAATIAEARDLLPVDVAVIDARLDGESGLQLVREIQQGHQGIRILVVSGTAVDVPENIDFLRKPYRLAELDDRLRSGGVRFGHADHAL